MYFNPFPKINYDCVGNGFTEQIQDITTRVVVRKWIQDRGSLFSKYRVGDGDTPEMTAYKLYGKTQYHWIILLFNEVFNSYYGWPLSRKDFYAFIDNKYANPNGTHHYEITQQSGDTTKKIKVESDVAGAIAVTNMEYEATIQDKKRQIKVLQPEFVEQFVSEFKRLLKKQQSL